jgi:hypothetical protein
VIDALIEKIHALQERYIAGDRDAGADLYGYRMQLIKALHLQRPGWRCLICHQHGTPCAVDPKLCRACDKALAQASQRRCRLCGDVKPLSCFVKSANQAKHYRDCAPCRWQRDKAKVQEYRKQNAAQIAAARRDYYDEHRDEVLAVSKRSYEKHRDQRLQSAAAWRAEHAEQHRARTRAWVDENRDAFNARRRERYQERKAER